MGVGKDAGQRQGQGSKTEMVARSRLGTKVCQGFRWRQEGVEDPREPSWEQVEQLGVSIPNNGGDGASGLGPGHQHANWDLLGSRWLLLPWLVRSCCQCQPGFRSHWRDTGRREVRRRKRGQAGCLDTPAHCLPGASSAWALAASTSPICCSLPPRPRPVPVAVENQGQEGFVHPPAG